MKVETASSPRARFEFWPFDFMALGVVSGLVAAQRGRARAASESAPGQHHDRHSRADCSAEFANSHAFLVEPKQTPPAETARLSCSRGPWPVVRIERDFARLVPPAKAGGYTHERPAAEIELVAK